MDTPGPIPWHLEQIELDEMHAQAALTDPSGNWDVYFTDIGDYANRYREVHDDSNDVVVPATAGADVESGRSHRSVGSQPSTPRVPLQAGSH